MKEEKSTKILVGGIEWKWLLKRFEINRSKKHRDSLCIKCWKMYSANYIKKHKNEKEEHAESILTSKYFCKQEKFI